MRKLTHTSNFFLIFLLGILMVLFFGLPARTEDTHLLSQEDERTLLKIARDTLNLYLSKRVVPSLKGYPITPNLQKEYGVFVTLKEKTTGNLRGCIGFILGRKPLAESVIDCTVQASTRDRRFSPMKAGENQTVNIEISVLTLPHTINNIDEIKVGLHGLIISRGLQTGVLLPQVPVEWGWNRDEFLKAICRKAGLPDRSWEKGATLQAFTAGVFGETHSN